jgi:hypothetical protein
MVELYKSTHDCVMAAHAHMPVTNTFYIGRQNYEERIYESYNHVLKCVTAILDHSHDGKVSPVAFRVKLPPIVRIHDVVHASRLLEKWNSEKNTHIAQRVRIVHDATRFEIVRLLDVAFNSNGGGLLFKVCWAAHL